MDQGAHSVDLTIDIEITQEGEVALVSYQHDINPNDAPGVTEEKQTGAQHDSLAAHNNTKAAINGRDQ